MPLYNGRWGGGGQSCVLLHAHGRTVSGVTARNLGELLTDLLTGPDLAFNPWITIEVRPRTKIGMVNETGDRLWMTCCELCPGYGNSNSIGNRVARITVW